MSRSNRLEGKDTQKILDRFGSNGSPYFEVPFERVFSLTPEETHEVVQNVLNELTREYQIRFEANSVNQLTAALSFSEYVTSLEAPMRGHDLSAEETIRLMALHTFAGILMLRAMRGVDLQTRASDYTLIRALHFTRAQSLGVQFALLSKYQEAVKHVTLLYGVIRMDEDTPKNMLHRYSDIPAILRSDKKTDKERSQLHRFCSGLMAPVAALQVLREVFFKGYPVKIFLPDPRVDAQDKIDILLAVGEEQHIPATVIQVKSNGTRALHLEAMDATDFHAAYELALGNAFGGIQITLRAGLFNGSSDNPKAAFNPLTGKCNQALLMVAGEMAANIRPSTLPKR